MVFISCRKVSKYQGFGTIFNQQQKIVEDKCYIMAVNNIKSGELSPNYGDISIKSGEIIQQDKNHILSSF